MSADLIKRLETLKHMADVLKANIRLLAEEIKDLNEQQREEKEDGNSIGDTDSFYDIFSGP